MSDVLIARESFSTDVNGIPTQITKGVTRVRVGHELARKNPDYFEPITVHFDVEQATKAPGEMRETAPKTAKAADKPAEKRTRS